MEILNFISWIVRIWWASQVLHLAQIQQDSICSLDALMMTTWWWRWWWWYDGDGGGGGDTMVMEVVVVVIRWWWRWWWWWYYDDGGGAGGDFFWKHSVWLLGPMLSLVSVYFAGWSCLVPLLALPFLLNLKFLLCPELRLQPSSHPCLPSYHRWSPPSP